jgi:hypothetical protein
MKKQLLSLLLVASSTIIMAQTNATNFTCNDCSGVSHELFKVLDSGKIVVLVWVMPCGACTGGAITAYNIVKSYQANNPNKVYFYLVDDYANTNCQSLGSWGASNGLDVSSYSYRFSNAAIKMTNYGSAGMPKCIVLAGTDHKVMYNVNNSVSSTDLQKAINTALVLTGTTEDNFTGSALKISPNPVNQSAILTCALDQASNVKIELLNADGKLIQNVFTGKLNSGENKMNLNVANYHSGIYYVTLSSGDKIKSAKFSVVH